MNFVIGLVLVLGIMILVHEWGHFVVARLFGVRVDVFSIGFGPRLFGWKRGATDYRVSALPVGGYVRMAGQDLSDVDSGNQAPTGGPDELMSKPRWQRALISFAGPAVNLIFPVLLLTGFYVVKGEPYLSFLNSPVEVLAFPARAASGPTSLRVGDKIVSMSGVQNPTWEQADKLLEAAAPGGHMALQVENGGLLRAVELVVPPRGIETSEQWIGFAPIPSIIDEVESGSPAARAGLQAEDRVVAVDGVPVQWWGQFVDHVRNSSGHAIGLTIERKHQALQKVVIPEQIAVPHGDPIYRVGVGSRQQFSYHRIPFTEAVRLGGAKTLLMTAGTVEVVGDLLIGRVSIRQLQGPVGITHEAGKAVRKGPVSLISLMVMISVNLGILNLLPVPILDGGHILLLAIEGSIRRNLSLAFKERFVQVGLVFLLVLFVIVMYNDVMRRLPFHS